MRTLDAEQSLEDRTMALFAELGWQTANALYEAFTPDAAGPNRPYLGRTDESTVLLLPRLRRALEALNPELPPAALDAAVTELGRGRSVLAPVAANREVHRLLTGRVPVVYRDAEGRERHARVQVIDWQNAGDNDFLMVQQLWVHGETYRRRPDLVGFVNGIPLLFGELKAHHRRLEEAYRKNLTDYKREIPHLFWYTGLVVLSNGSESLLGNFAADFRHFSTWKRVANEEEQGIISLETLVRATCTPARLLDLVRNYTLYYEGRGLEKITAKNHQFLGVENLLEALEQVRENQGRLGVFWHTQGSGKSFSMIFFAQKVLRTRGGNWTFVILTDREQLDEQIYKNFARTGAVTEDEKQSRAQSGEHLRRLLQEDHRYIFTLVQKFHTRDDDAPYPVLSTRDDIVVITDEAHRSQYNVLAMNLRRALPNAAFIGFTGTPLMAEEKELTRQVFGDYVSVYNFRESIEDGATVPLYYENRVPEVQLTNEALNAEMEQLLERAEVEEEAEALLAREFLREYHVITRDDRLEKVAADIVDHFIHRGYRGKGMVISIDKLTTVKMHAKVQTHWERTLRSLRQQLAEASPLERPALEARIAFMESTEMAVVISQAPDEVPFFAEHGFDIRPHRERIVNEDLAERFKKADDPFRLAFVCAMWRTGFDAPACSTIYLDRPMRNHTLMQTIARANRVHGEKANGLIVDYVGIFRELQRALAIYATGPDTPEGDFPIQEKGALVEDLRAALAEVALFCERRGVDLERVVEQTDVFEHIRRVDEATARLVDKEAGETLDDSVEQILVNDELQSRFLDLVAHVDRLFRAILPDPRAAEFEARRNLLLLLAEKIRRLSPETREEVPDLQAEVTQILDESIKTRTYVIHEESPLYDLSKVDFEALKERFRTGRKRTEAAQLRGSLNAQLQRMIRRNRSRLDYREEFERLIEAYNEGAANVDFFFDRLVDFARQLQEEERRHIRENLSEEELAVFDILTRPRMNLTEEETRQVKEVARDLLESLKQEKLVLDWRKRQKYRAGVRLTIETFLFDRLPERYTAQLCERKRDDLYQHVYEHYAGAGQSVYEPE